MLLFISVETLTLSGILSKTKSAFLVSYKEMFVVVVVVVHLL